MLDYKKVFSDTVAKAEQLFKIDCSNLKLVVDDKPLNKTAAAFYKPSTTTVHLNKITLDTFADDTLSNTIIHEIAHHVTALIYPRRKQEHGPEFKNVYRILGGLGKTHVQSQECAKAFSLALQGDSPKAKTFTYVCSSDNKCQTFEFTKNRHTRVLRGAGYICGKCKSPLIYVK